MAALAAALVGGFAVWEFPSAVAQTDGAVAKATATDRQDDRTTAVLWMQNSDEYRHIAEQAFELAAIRLDQGLDDPSWSADVEQLQQGSFGEKPPAVILDLDETVLDNSPYNARGIEDATQFSTESWNNWVRERKAGLVPGAKDFIRNATGKGVAVFFVTNRSDEVRRETIENLKQLGIDADWSTVITKNGTEGRSRDKVSRRKQIAADYRIVLLVGDKTSDHFLETEEGSSELAAALTPELQKAIKRRWIWLPNPVYGDWERKRGELKTAR